MTLCVKIYATQLYVFKLTVLLPSKIVCWYELILVSWCSSCYSSINNQHYKDQSILMQYTCIYFVKTFSYLSLVR